MPSTIELLESLLHQCMGRDISRFSQRLHALARRPDTDPAWPKLTDDINRSRALRDRRAKAAPSHIHYPPDLPVSQAKPEILDALRNHQVVVLAGETGSGKTTQLPKMCLELGRGIGGTIGHTQPRRIAARSVAQRIADELGTHLGGGVGYKVRFTDQSADTSLIKLMTDGILLAETQNDPLLLQYDTLILDEAHERSLNIDFLLGYLKQLLPKRPDLKLIITSATIDPQRFAKHFSDVPGGCPMLEVSGRTFPVETRYRPVTTDDPELDEDGRPLPVVVDPIDAICSAVEEVLREPEKGDVLVFHASEREIRETASALSDRLRDVDVLPLFARLSVEDQQRVFKPGGRRRVVLATNVAETSVTVPNIRYVIDPGEARISRYSTRTKVQRLPIEPISQASANQRKGRCGRVGPGVCVRLYSEADFTSRPAFTDPEISRTNLAAVILQMTALKLGDVAAFPFLDPPDYRQIRDGYNTLYELGAVTEEKVLTELGRRLARLPTDPRIGRMVLAALDEGVLDEVLVIAAALSVQDPKDRPLELAQQADAAHATFKDESSDFLGILKLWTAYQDKSRQLTSSRLRKWCRDHFLSYNRMREWQETHRQLRSLAADSLAERRTAYRRRQHALGHPAVDAPSGAHRPGPRPDGAAHPPHGSPRRPDRNARRPDGAGPRTDGAGARTDGAGLRTDGAGGRHDRGARGTHPPASGPRQRPERRGDARPTHDTSDPSHAPHALHSPATPDPASAAGTPAPSAAGGIPSGRGDRRRRHRHRGGAGPQSPAGGPSTAAPSHPPHSTAAGAGPTHLPPDSVTPDEPDTAPPPVAPGSPADA